MELVERFVRHSWYSPSRQLTIVTSLESLELASDRGRFVRVAIAANEPGDTFFFARMALMLAGFNDREDAIDQILAPNGLVMAYTVNDEIVLPMVLDLGLWTAIE